MVPLTRGPVPRVLIPASGDGEVTAELRICSQREAHTPDTTLATATVPVVDGQLTFDFGVDAPRDCYGFVCLQMTPGVTLKTTDHRITGVLSLFKPDHGNCTAEEGKRFGFEPFEFWSPRRRPDGRNLAITLDPPATPFAAGNLTNGVFRPTDITNAWAADLDDDTPTVELSWKAPQRLRRIDLHFDGDFDHPMETVLHGHPERVVPFCVRQYMLIAVSPDGDETVIVDEPSNHLSHRTHHVAHDLLIQKLQLTLRHPSNTTPAALFGIRCYG